MNTQYMGVDVCIKLAVLLFKIVIRYFYNNVLIQLHEYTIHGVDVCINLASPSSTIGTDHWQAKGRPFMALKMIKFSHYRSNCAKDKPQNG